MGIGYFEIISEYIIEAYFQGRDAGAFGLLLL